jgi:hypothetical protein
MAVACVMELAFRLIGRVPLIISNIQPNRTIPKVKTIMGFAFAMALEFKGI